MGSRDALCQLLQLGDHAQGCCIPPHQGVRWPLSGSSAIVKPLSRMRPVQTIFFPSLGDLCGGLTAQDHREAYKRGEE